jgi:YYY domain-containing protein
LSLQPIDEFPSFSFMLGDLHPHVLALPFGLAVLGLGLELFLRIRSSTAGSAAGPDLNAQFPLSWIGFASLALGGLAFLNTWDFPIYLLVCATATWLAWRGGTRAGWRGLVGRWAVVIALGILLYLPFYLTFSSQAAGVLPNLIFVTKGQQFAVMFGPLLLPIVLWMIALAASQRRRPMWAQGACLAALVPIILFLCSLGLGILLWQNPFAAQLVRSLIQPMTVGQALVALLERRLLMLGTLIALGVILGLSLAVLLPTLREWSPQAAASPAFPPAGRSHSMGVVPLSAAESFVLLLVAGGVILALVPEFVYLRDQFGTRMNTIFKFYFQAWTLWSLAAAYGLASLWRWSRAHGRSDSTAGNWAPKVLGGRLGAWIASAGLLLGFVYTPLSVWTKTSGFGLGTSATLDASAHLSSDDPDDAQAIAWMNANLRDGTLVEAVGGEYSDFARISTYTGIPTVLGWAGHEAQWRGGYNEVGSREEDIAQLYRTEDWATALRLIQRYQIEYIYFGPLEIQTYGTQGLAKFQAHLHVAYQGGSATLFEAEPAPPAGVS